MDERFICDADMYRHEANLIWKEFSDELRYRNRFFTKHRLLDLVQSYCLKNEHIMTENSILYRARILNCNSNEKDCIGLLNRENKTDHFWGYNAKESMAAPKELAKTGRLNPENIVYLYTVESIITAIIEVRPLLKDHISVATIKVETAKKLVDFSNPTNLRPTSEEEALIAHLIGKFSTIVKNDKDYIETQYISEFIKHLGYDGIRFSSSLDWNGINVTLFKFDKCTALKSFPYILDNVIYKAR